MGKPLLFISDGTNEINLLDPKAIMVNGWKPKMPQLKGGGIYSNSALADGKELVIESYDNVVEEMPLFVNGKDPDQIGAVQHVLFDLLRTLRSYFTRAERETTPVYLGWRPKDQTNIQYALLKNYSLDTDTEGFGHEIKGSLFKPAVMAGTLNLERENGWRDNPPGILPSRLSISQPDTASALTTILVPNYYSRHDLTHIYAYDDSTATFSANNAGVAAFTYFDLGGPVPAANDIQYFGSTQGPFFNIVVNLGNVFNVNATFMWEYWNGAAWTDADTPNLVAGTFTSGFNGYLHITFNGHLSWSKTVINGVNAYWLRLRIVSVTSWTASGTNVTRPVYVANDEYIEVSSSNIVGDIASLMRMYIAAGNVGLTSNKPKSNWVAIGVKSRGLGNFYSRLNVGVQRPPNWTITYGTNTTISQDGAHAGGERAGVSWGSSIAMTERVRWELLNRDMPGDWKGTYQVYGIVQQIGGSVGDCSIRLVNGSGGARVIGDTIKLTRVNQGREIIDLGKFAIPVSFPNQYAYVHNLKFSLDASAVSTSGSRFLFVYELVFLPIDEWAMIVKDPAAESGVDTTHSIKGGNSVEIDSGVVTEEAILTGFVGGDSYNVSQNTRGSIIPWEMRGQPLKLFPNRTNRLYFLFGTWPAGETTGTMLQQSGPGALISMFVHHRWLGLRGDE